MNLKMKPRQATSYHQFLVHNYAGVLRVWCLPMVVFHVLTAALQQGAGTNSIGHALISLACCLCCWAISKATARRKTMLLRGLFLFFGCLQMAFYLNYVWEKNTIAKVHLFFDIGTYMYSVTPQLVIGLNSAPMIAYILFIGGHVAAASLLYYHIAKMSWYFAVLRALGIQILVLSAALLVHKRARALLRSSVCAYQQLQQQHEPQQPHDEGPSKAGGTEQSSMAVARATSSTQRLPRPEDVIKGARIKSAHRGDKKEEDAQQQAQANSKEEKEEKDVQQQQQQQQQAQVQAKPETLQEQQQQHFQQQQQQFQQLQQMEQAQQQQAQASEHANPGSLREQQQVKQTLLQQQQQQHSTCELEKRSSAANQEQALIKEGGGMQHCSRGHSTLHDSVNMDKIFSHCCARALNPSNPATQEAMVKAAHALADRRRRGQLYASRMGQPSDPNFNRALRESCRLIVKLNNLSTPDHIPKKGIAELQHKLQRYQCLAPAVRSGCLVISYDTAPFGPGCTLEEMSKEVLPEAKEWAQEQGLLEPGEDLLTVQACRSTYWDSALDGQPSPVYCMAVHTPFLVPNPDSSTPASSTQEQPFQQQDNHAETGQAMRKQGHAEFELTIYAPNTDLELRGWQGSTDAPEDLPDAVKSRSLCLLATLGGQFLGVTVKEERPSRNEERVVQVCVRLPADSLDAGSGCPQPLMLELWAAGTLVCCYSALLVTLSSTSAGAAALAELQGWAAGLTGTHPEDSGPFTRDLVRWLRFQACSQQEQQASIAAKEADLLDGPMQQQQQQQQHGMVAARDADLADGAMQQQQLELMKAVGVDLLEYSLSQGMEGVAGLLLDCFASFPFCIPPLTLLDTLSAARPEDQPCAPPASTLHSSSHLNTTLHSCPSPEAPAPSIPTTAAPATTPSSAITCIVAASSAVSCKLAAVVRGLCAQPSKEEADYRAWSNAQVAPLARFWCRLSVLHICVGALRVACIEGMSPLLALSSWGTILLGYIVGALFIRPGSPSSEVILVAVAVARASHCIALGLGLISISGTNHLLCSWRVEAVAEVLIMSLMERVRLNWMVPLRALLALSTWLMYVQMGLSCPATQAVLLNLYSLGVTAAMEQRCRRLYSHPRLHAKQQACGAFPRLHTKQQALADGDANQAQVSNNGFQPKAP